MAVEVRLPTLLRAHADGASSVTAEGATVGEVFTDLTRAYPGSPATWSTTTARLHKFVNVYVNDDDIRYLDAARHQGRRRRRDLDPAGGRRRADAVPAATVTRHERILGTHRRHAARRRPRAVAQPRRPDLRQARGPEPRRLVEGPHRAQDGGARRGRRRALRRATRSSSRRRATPGIGLALVAQAAAATTCGS